MIRELKKSDSDFQTVLKMISDEWGMDSVANFKSEFSNKRCVPYRHFMAYYNRKKILGVIGISISEISYEMWGITWLIVNNKHRNKKIGTRLVRFAERFFLKNSPLDICLVQLTTSAPKFYRKLGYKIIKEWEDEDGPRFLMFKTLKGLNGKWQRL